MFWSVSCCSRHDDREVMEEMTRGRFRHMPVMEHGQLIGIVSIGDVVKHRLEDIRAKPRAGRC